MENIQEKILTWDDIKNDYPNQWVVLGNPIFNSMAILNGTVLSHHQDKRIASIEGGERRTGLKKFTLIFTGQHQVNAHIGLLRTI